MSVLPPATNGWWRVGGDYVDPGGGVGSGVFTLESSEDLRTWDSLAVLLQAPFAYADPRPPGLARFYRLAIGPLTETNDWANQLRYPADPFFNSGDC